MKFLVLLAVLLVAYLVWRGKRVAKAPSRPRTPALPTPQDMLACARCGVHVPRSHAWISDGRSYCSREHQQQDGN
jgi:uncharacterized protein